MNKDESFAHEVGLRYVHDREPGLSRKRRGKGFSYVDHRNRVVRSNILLARLTALVIPPAWENVWICRHENGHIQVTGRDVRLRKQYRYHTRWSELRNQNKFHNLERFGKLLPKIRARLKQDLAKQSFSRECVLAAVVSVMEKTHIRVGNDIYTHLNKSYGLTTLLNKHVRVKGDHVDFKFRGKSGVEREVALDDKRLSQIIRKCQELPGQELFAYRDSFGRIHDVGSHDVNEYLREISGAHITAKDFRTWAGTVEAIQTLNTIPPLVKPTQKAFKKRERQVIEAAAKALGNTPTVCRKYYVYPPVFDLDRKGELSAIWKKCSRGNARDMSAGERTLLQILKLK